MLGLGFATFVVFGGLLVLVGATQASLAAGLELDLAQTGLLAAALSAGLGIGVVGAGPIADRFSRRASFVAAAGLAAACLLPLRWDAGFAAALAAVAGAGAAGGALETLLNAAIADRWREGAARPLSGVHTGAALGAVLGPPLLGGIAAAAGWQVAFAALGLAFATLAVAGLGVRLPPPAPRAPGATRGRVPWRALAPLALALACYVALETALTAFAVPWAASLGLPRERGVRAISALWLGLLLGRVLLLGWRGPLDERAVAAAGAAASAILAAAVALRAPQLETVFGAIGLCLGGVFPLLVARAAARAPEARGTAAGAVAGAGAVGALVASALTGVLGDAFGMRAATASLGLWGAALALLAWSQRREVRPSPR